LHTQRVDSASFIYIVIIDLIDSLLLEYIPQSTDDTLI
jgi:hypothetical protein